MKKFLKRTEAILCTVTLVIGCILAGNGHPVKAEEGSVKEWSIISSDTKVSNGILQMKSLNLELDKTDADRENLAVYIKATLKDDAAVATMKGACIELSQDTNDIAEIQWDNLEDRDLHTGINDILLKLSEGSDQIKSQGDAVIDLSKTINHFRIFNVTAGVDWSGVTLNEVKLVDLAPMVKEYTGATAGTAPADVPVGYVFSGWYTDAACKNVLTGTSEDTVYAKFINEDVLTVKAQYAGKAVEPGMIVDCDSLYGEKESNVIVTEVAGEVKEGTGAYKCTTGQQIRTHVTLTDPVDISAYQNGRLHLQLYVDGVDTIRNNNGLRVELGNAKEDGTTHEIMIKWTISADELVDKAWNELYLDFDGIKRWTNTGSSLTEVDFTKVDYFRIYQGTTTSNTVITTIVDDVRAVETLPHKVLADCESAGTGWMQDQTVGNVTTNSAYVKKGTGAIMLSGASQFRFRMVLDKGVDLSGYKALHFWLYVNDPTKLSGDLKVGISSNGVPDSVEIKWTVLQSELKAGWNEINLNFADAAYTTGFLSKNVNYMRIYQNSGAGTSDLVTSVDDICAVSELPGALITDCEKNDFLSLVNGFDVTSTDYAEGKAAFISTGSRQVRFSIGLKEAVDISAYQDGGIHFWLYVGDKSDWTSDKGSLMVELTSSGGADTNEWNWSVKSSDLQANSWNEMTLNFSNHGTQGGDLNLAAVNFLRIYFSNGGVDTKLILDDVRAVPAEPEKVIRKADIRFVTTVDSLDYQNVGFDITVNKNQKVSSTKVYKKLYAIGSDKETITYTPWGAFAPQSKYFNAYIIYNIPNENFDVDIHVRAYWTTQDGTEVYGPERTFTVNDMISANN